jgi:hypothetical protein
MVWWLAVLVAWAVIAVAVGLVLGAVLSMRDRHQQPRQAPSFVPDEWSLTTSR